MDKKRNLKYDILKVIALFCIILAHVNPNGFIFQLRNFDVPLMIIISVWLSISLTERRSFNYKKYIFKRIKRLVIPTWSFLTIYFILNFIWGNVFSMKTIFLSYSLISGIGYVRVIRIYLYIAILAPILYYLINKVSRKYIIIFMVLEYIIYIFLIRLSFHLSGALNVIFTATFLDFIGYSFIIFIAIFTYKINRKNSLLLSVIFMVCFFILMINYNFEPTQNFKYPLRIYYLTYAFSIIYLLNFLLDFINNKFRIKENKFILYISKNSMWIYLWHILYISKVNTMFINLHLGCCFRFIIIILLAIITTSIQNEFLKYFKKFVLKRIYKNNF